MVLSLDDDLEKFLSGAIASLIRYFSLEGLSLSARIEQVFAVVFCNENSSFFKP